MKADLPLGKYRHYKGGEYEVLGIAHHSETMEPLVVYKQLYDSAEYPSGSLWVRPLSMFTETVIVEGRGVPRFAWIENDNGTRA